MKLTQILLCKTPFTPSYEHIVTGCSSTEFYNKLSTDSNNITISLALNNATFRTVRETDREIVLSINLVNNTLITFKPQDFNYIATYEEQPTSYRFWFVDSYNVDNSALWPTVTFYCSIDYWHSYCLVSSDNFISQHITRITQNGANSNNIYFNEEDSIPHTVKIISNKRILWGRARINMTAYISSNTLNGKCGTVLDGSLAHFYVPLALMSGNSIDFKYIGVNMEQGYEFIYIKNDGSISSTNYNSGYIGGYDPEESVRILSELATIDSFDLTYLPPFDYSIYENNLGVSVNILGGCKVIGIHGVGEAPGDTGLYLLTPSLLDNNKFSKSIIYNINIPSPTQSTPDNYFYNRYPYRYYSAIVGGKEFNVNYPVTSFRFDITNNGSGNSSSCSVYCNGNCIADNIEISNSVNLPITKNQAGQIEAIYGSSYRMDKVLLSLIPKLTKAVSSKGISLINDIPQSIMQLYEYTREDNIPTTVYSPTSQSSQIAYGDYPFIKEYSIKSGYEKCISSKIKMIGEIVDYYDIPIPINHYYYDYVKTSNCITLTKLLNSKGNSQLSNAFNRGVYLWHFDKINNISTDIGNFSVINSNR